MSKANFAQQFERSGDASPPRSPPKTARASIGVQGALQKYAAPGADIKGMSGAQTREPPHGSPCAV